MQSRKESIKMSRSVKICVVGDGYVGKTCLLMAYTSGVYNDVYIPTVFENYADKIIVDDVQYNMALWDTAGQEDYERLRPLSYPGTTCFLICFSIDNKASYENIKTKWAPEVKHHVPSGPCIIVGTKSDLRHVDDPNLILTSEKDGQKLKKGIQADGYFECSAKNMVGLDIIFQSAVRSSIKMLNSNRKRPCFIL